jgi:hypothetical protein
MLPDKKLITRREEILFHLVFQSDNQPQLNVVGTKLNLTTYSEHAYDETSCYELIMWATVNVGNDTRATWRQ